jgi:hypothetical protein
LYSINSHTAGARKKSTFSIRVYHSLRFTLLYYDHQAEFDVEIMRQLKEVEAYAEAAKDSPGRRRLRERNPI